MGCSTAFLLFSFDLLISLLLLSPLMASIGISLLVLRKPNRPWQRAFCGSYPSSVFCNSQGPCELVIFSVGDEPSLSSIPICISKSLDG